MSGWTAKRFWKAATAEPVEGGFAVHLDGRAVSTADLLGHPLLLVFERSVDW